MTKRCLDIACATVGLALFSPVLLVVAAMIRGEDGGPILFRQDRVGRFGSAFRVFKFRTMRNGEVTGVGRWLRGTGIDEIPQFINVLFGDMSVVGPRPLTRMDIERLGWNIPRYEERWSVRPGITGLAQLYGGYSARVSWYLDRRYLRFQSVLLDLWLIFLSFVVNIVGKQRMRVWLTGRRAARTGRGGGSCPAA